MKFPSEQIAALPLSVKLISAIIGIFLIRGAFHLLERTLPSRFGYADARYRVRKAVSLAGYLVVFGFVMLLFQDRLKQVSFALGVMGAGVVVALQDVIASIGGWFAIGFSSLYRVGDRIQIGDTKGDVIDISVLRTTVMEIGNWVSGDLYNGRISRIPNSFVLKGFVFNYSQGFRFVWDEVKIRLAFESNHLHAREVLLRLAKETVTDNLLEAQTSWNRIAENYQIETPVLEPTVTLVISDGSLDFSLSYPVAYTKRTVVKDQLFTKILDEIANSKGRLTWAASSTNTIIKPVMTDSKSSSHPLLSATDGAAR